MAVGIHAADEAVHDFLSVYNPMVYRIREQISFFPMPTFSFGPWITGLAVAVLLGLASSPLVFHRATPMRIVAVAVSTLMVLNALGHAIWSVGTGTVVPGTYSSPILLLAAVWMLARALGGWQAPTPSPPGASS